MKTDLFILILAICSLTAFEPMHRTKTPAGELSWTNVSFNGEGEARSTRVTFTGTVTNTTPQRWAWMRLCLRAIDEQGLPVNVFGAECLVELTASNLNPGGSVNFNFRRKVKIADSKRPVRWNGYEILFLDGSDLPSNVRRFPHNCDSLWSPALQMFVQSGFSILNSDRPGGVVSLQWQKGQTAGSEVKAHVRAFTTAQPRFLDIYERFRIDSVTAVFTEAVGDCQVGINASYAVFYKPFLGAYGWYALESNGALEQKLLAGLTAATPSVGAPAKVQTTPPTTSAVEAARVNVNSDPADAEIEVDGKFAGSTPSTLTLKPGLYKLVIRKKGHQSWEREIEVGAGATVNVNAQLPQQQRQELLKPEPMRSRTGEGSEPSTARASESKASQDQKRPPDTRVVKLP